MRGPKLALVGRLVDSRRSLVRVDKSHRRIELVAGERSFGLTRLRTATIRVGHKQQGGDQRTPEGRYLLDWRNPQSGHYRSMHISYPNAEEELRRQTQASCAAYS